MLAMFALLGCNSLIVFVAQHFVFYALIYSRHLPYTPLWPLLFSPSAIPGWRPGRAGSAPVRVDRRGDPEPPERCLALTLDRIGRQESPRLAHAIVSVPGEPTFREDQRPLCVRDFAQ